MIIDELDEISTHSSQMPHILVEKYTNQLFEVHLSIEAVLKPTAFEN